MRIATAGAPAATIVVGEQPTWLERHAVEELQSYLRRMSGAELPIADAKSAKGPAIAVGRAETNPLVRRAVDAGLVELSPEDPGTDGFVMKAVRLDDRDVLVLGGSSDRATLFAAYSFLENVLGVGFFRDGERIPERTDIEIDPLDVAERPRFAEREDGNGCFFTYSASGWVWEDWKREFDWKAKRRANIVWPLSVGGEIMGELLHDWGVTADPPKKRAGDPTLHERAFAYARKLGMRVPIIVPAGRMPDRFWEVFPQARKLVMQWSELAPYNQLHPDDPLFRKLVVEYIRRFAERYGNDHLYIAEFASESRILEGAADVQEARIMFARNVSAALREADPQAVWVPSSWSFDLSADDPGNPWQANWTLDNVREYLDAIDVPLVVWDLWSEEAGKYLDTDYFYGHPWGFGVLHSFGAGSFLHGDVNKLVDRVHDVLESTGAKTCNLFLSQPEIVHYNGFYLELAARLSWNPAKVTVENYVEWYCAKRYGEAGAALEEAWRMLVDTVYGPESGTVKIIMDPLYWFRPTIEMCPGWPEDMELTNKLRAGRPRYVPVLRRVIDLFLAQAELLAANAMARRDLVDIAGQWYSERFNIAIVRGRDAFLAGDLDNVRGAGRECRTILEEKARMLSAWPPYRLDREIESERLRWGDDAPRAVKHRHVWTTTSETEHSVPLRDYYRMDLDGLLADYYGKRVTAYFDLLERKLAAGERTVSEDEFEAIYAPIEADFIAAAPRSLPAGEDPVAVIRELVAGTPE